MQNKKGQAAMEYLMTYGWALLVIVIVLALLLIILGGYLRGTPSCVFGEAGFSCSEITPIIKGGATGEIYGQFKHMKEEDIEIKGATFIAGQVNKDFIDTNHLWQYISGSKSLAPRTPYSFGDLIVPPLSAPGLKVYGTDGTHENTLTPGSQIRGQLWIRYNLRSDTQIGYTGYRTAVATVIANVE